MAAINHRKAREQAERNASEKMGRMRSVRAENALHDSVPAAAASVSDKEKERALEGIHPACLDYLKSSLGLDLSSPSVSARQVWDLRKGKMTGPFLVTVTPVVYDRELKKKVSAPPVRALISAKVGFPVVGRQIVEPDDRHRMFVQTLPVRPLVLKGEAAGSRTEPAESNVVEDAVASKLPRVDFTSAQIAALEGAGISPDRLFAGRNHLSSAQKSALAAGQPVEIDGVFKTSSGIYVYAHGEVVLDGAKASFEPVVMRPLEDNVMIPTLASLDEGELKGHVRDDFQIELDEAVRQGMVDFDIYRRDGAGKIMHMPDGSPMFNAAGRNLLEFGSSMGPVVGWVHDGTGKVTKAYYTLSVVNGAIAGEAMKEKPVLGKDLKPLVREVWNKEKGKKVKMPVVEHVVRDITTDDAKVYVDGVREPLEFVSHEDYLDFTHGKPAKVKGLVYHDFKNGRNITHDGYVVYDAARVFARPFSPSSSKRIEEAKNLESARRTGLKSKSYGVE